MVDHLIFVRGGRGHIQGWEWFAVLCNLSESFAGLCNLSESFTDLCKNLGQYDRPRVHLFTRWEMCAGFPTEPGKPGDLKIISPGLKIAWNLSPKVTKQEIYQKAWIKPGMLQTYTTFQYYIELLYMSKFCTPVILEQLWRLPFGVKIVCNITWRTGLLTWTKPGMFWLKKLGSLCVYLPGLSYHWPKFKLFTNKLSGYIYFVFMSVSFFIYPLPPPHSTDWLMVSPIHVAWH